MRRAISRSATTILFVALLAAGCGDDGGFAGPPATTAPAGRPSPTDEPSDERPGRFPIPIPQGGELVSEFPGEATFRYPESAFDAVRAFYDDYAADHEVVSSGELFDGGFEWQVGEGDALHVIVLTLEPPDAVLLARVLDR